MSCSSHTETRCLSKCESNKQDSHVFKEIVTAPLLEAEPESELLNPKPQTSNEETPASSSASGKTIFISNEIELLSTKF